MMAKVNDPGRLKLEALIEELENDEEFHRNLAQARQCFAEARALLGLPPLDEKAVASPRRAA